MTTLIMALLLQAQDEQVVRMVPLINAIASDVVTAVKEKFGPATKIQADVRTNTVVFTAGKSTADAIQKAIDALDAP